MDVKKRGCDVVRHLPGGAVRLRCGAVIDRADLSLVQLIGGWYVPTSGGWKGYAVATYNTESGRKRIVAMHRWILREPATLIDHRDQKPLNNRRKNLRPTTKANNGANRGGNTGRRYKGVFRNRAGCRLPWRAQIGKTINGRLRQFHLGSFWTKREAAVAYDKAARRLFGAFAAPNFPKATRVIPSRRAS